MGMPEQSPAAHSWELLNAQASSAGDMPLHSPWFIVCLTLKETQHPCTPWLLLSAGNVFHNFLAQGHGTAYRHYFRCVKEMILEGQSVHLSQGRPISHCIIELMFPIWTIWVWSLDWPLCSCETFVFLLQCALSLSLFLPLWTPTFILTLLPSQLSHKMGIIFHSSSCCHNCSSWGLTPPTSLPSLSPKWKFHLNTISACVGSRPEVPVCSLGLAQSPHKARSSPDAQCWDRSSVHHQEGAMRLCACLHRWRWLSVGLQRWRALWGSGARPTWMQSPVSPALCA